MGQPLDPSASTILDMKLSIALFGVLAVAAIKLAAADCDTSTEAGIAAAYKKATGNEVSKDHNCLRRSRTFKGLVWTGEFAYDRGCMGQGVLVGCALNPPGYDKAAMSKAGWDKADLAGRNKLAVAWLTEIDNLSVVDRKPDKFTKPFAPAAATADGNKLVVEVWTVDPPGMAPTTYYHKNKIVFEADGSHGEIAETDRFEIPIR